MCILIVDDSIDTQLLIKRHLNNKGYNDVLLASSVNEAYRILNIDQPESTCKVDLILMDVMMPEIDGIEACHAIHTKPHLKDIPIIMVTAKTELAALEISLEKGAFDYIKKPFNKVELLARIKSALRLKEEMDKRKAREEELVKLNQKLKKLSSLDGLTGIANRRYFDEYFQIEWEKAYQNKTPISLILFDLDHFKAYNDTYGHQKGDDCLKLIVETAASVVNPSSSLVSRYGGEEFAIVLPETDIKGVEFIANQLREKVEERKIVHSSSEVSRYVTVSVGASTFYPNGNLTMEYGIHLTDQALYISKGNGRNCVTVNNIYVPITI